MPKIAIATAGEATIVVAAEDLIDHVALADFVVAHAHDPERIHEVVALFGKVGLGRRFVGTVAKVLGVLGVLQTALAAFMLHKSGERTLAGRVALASGLYCLAWYVAGSALFNWGRGAQRRADLVKKIAATKSPGEKKKLQEQLGKLTKAHDMAVKIKQSKILADPNVKANLAKKDPATVRQIGRALTNLA